MTRVLDTPDIDYYLKRIRSYPKSFRRGVCELIKKDSDADDNAKEAAKTVLGELDKPCGEG